MIFKKSVWVCVLTLSGYWFPAMADPGLKFIKNKTQWPKQIDFMAKIPGGNFSLQAGSFRYSFLDQRKIEELHEQSHGKNKEIDSHHELNQQIDGQIIQATFLGSNVQATPQPLGELSEYYNYFLGNDSAQWSSNVRAYEGVIYPNFYEGIDLKVYSQGQNLKYDFIVSPGSDFSSIRFQYKGADDIYLKNGDLIVHTALADIIEKKPLIFQIIEGKKVYIKGSYELINQQVSFCLQEYYDPCYELVIDPLLIFSTYSGSTADNWGSTATPGEHGTLYSSGVTTTVNAGGFFPATPGAFQTTNGGLYDVAILKYDSSGSQLLYASFLGGSQSESPHSLVMTMNEELLILGTTSSSNFPVSVSAIDRSFNGGVPENNVIGYNNGSDIFIAKISKNGNQLLASTYLGGSKNDGLNPTNSPLVKNYGDQLRGDIISDSNGNIFVSTVTSSSDFPVKTLLDSTYNGGATDALLMKLNSDLSQITWATFLGGSLADASHTIQIDKNGNLFVGGGSASADFVMTPSAYQTTYAGGADGWIAKISGDGTSVLKSTFTGTTLFNQVYFLDLDQEENVYVYGQTQGAFPVTANVYSNPNSGQFLQKFNNSLDTLVFSTVFGSSIGIPNISPTAFLVNDCNNIYLSGWGGVVNSAEGFWQSSTVGMAVTPDAFQSTTSGSDFYLMVLSSDASQFLYGTFLGGTTSRTHMDGGTCRFDKGGVVYHAVCAGCAAFNSTGVSTSDFPATANAWSRVNRSGNCNNAAFKFDLSSLRARIQTNSIALNQPGLKTVCLPDKVVFQNKSIGGETYFWDFDDGKKQTTTNRNDIIHQYALPGSYTVKLKAVDLGTCIGKDSVKTTILASVPQGFAGLDMTVCISDGAQLFAGGGIDYQWKASDNSFTSNSPTPKVLPKKNTSYFVSITDANGCAKKDTVNIMVLTLLKAQIQTNSIELDRPGLNTICVNDRIVFQNRSIGGVTFFWALDEKNKQTKNDTSSITFKYDLPGNYTIKLKAIDTGSCTGKDSTQTQILVSIPLGFAGPDQVMCFDGGTQLVAGGGIDYQWKTADNSFKSSQPTPSVNPKEKTAYYVSITDVNGCIKKDTVNVRVVASIDLQFKADRVDYDCYNRPSVKVINQTDPDEEVFFDFGDGTTSDLPTVTHSYSKDGLFPIRLVGKKESCIYDKVISVPIFELKVPNVFTPEQTPDFNDTFVIEYGGHPISKSTLNVSLVIYNRWGAKVYENKNYKDEWTAHDISAGTYYYETRIEGETNCKGWVQVIK
ncbi:MAG: PKD domain-containing protein [Cyclobacteriaceae bacterium]